LVDIKDGFVGLPYLFQKFGRSRGINHDDHDCPPTNFLAPNLHESDVDAMLTEQSPHSPDDSRTVNLLNHDSVTFRQDINSVAIDLDDARTNAMEDCSRN